MLLKYDGETKQNGNEADGENNQFHSSNVSMPSFSGKIVKRGSTSR
jgi:hypothetical protein